MTTAEKTGLCENCKEIKPVAYTDPVDRQYCAACFQALPVATPGRIIDYLVRTVPFKVGDRVECRTAEVLYDGIGTIDEVSMEIEKFGTPFHPAFHVVIEEKAYPEAPDDVWYMERQLKKVS
jgi:hypothetical protein